MPDRWLRGQTISHYRILEKLGGGGMGVVYKAEDTRLKRVVALKFLPADAIQNPAALERFRREAEAASALNHPNICTIFDIGEHEAEPFIAMELLESRTLNHAVAEKSLSLDQVLDLGIEIADALDTAHSKHIIHRDIKPANVFITDRGHAKVLDFGLAKLTAARPTPETVGVSALATLGCDDSLTSPGVALGTVAYMSPEQIRGEELDARSDIFSLGLVLYEMVAGRSAFPGKTSGLITDAILNHSPLPLTSINPDLPTKIDDIICKALEKDRNLRYQHVSELRTDLQRLKRDSDSGRKFTSTTASPGVVVEAVPTSTPLRRYRSALLLLALSALILAGVAVAFLFLRSAAPPRAQRSLSRLTFDDGLQTGATWSPDGRYIAYASDRGGKFDVWVQQVSGGDPVQATSGPGHHWQPDWSPDGKYIMYRSEEGEGGLYIVPAIGGAGLSRRVSSFGFYPRWSPDGSQILFRSQFEFVDEPPKLFTVGLDGSPPKQRFNDFTKSQLSTGAAAWHPDGKRISLLAESGSPVPEFWTLPLDGGPPIKSEAPASLRAELERMQAQQGGEFSLRTLSTSGFSWAPSGQAVYLSRTFQGAKNIWKIMVDPQSLQFRSAERLTAGPGPDSDVAISKDGQKIAFDSKSEHARIWVFPFDPVGHRVTGDGEPVTSLAVTPLEHVMSRDSKRVAFAAIRAGKSELWEESLADRQENRLIADEYVRSSPVWSPDGTMLAYTRRSYSQQESQLMLWSLADRSERPLTSSTAQFTLPFDWSSDGRQLVVSRGNAQTQAAEIWMIPVSAAPRAETAARKLASHPDLQLWQSRLSPNGRWVVFEATAAPGKESIGSSLYVTSTQGGPWTRITDGKQWDDKPAWSTDGRAIYFVSARHGFFNVWGVRFDPDHGVPLGEPFQITKLNRPSLMVPVQIEPVALSVTRDRIALTVAQVSGSIWTLDNVDR